MKYYPLAKPRITARDKKYVLEVLNSGVLSGGEKTRIFEKKFAEFIGIKYACALASGTAGLHLALLAAGLGPGDEVITSPFSFVASANAVLYVGARPVFVDIEPASYALDPAQIEKRITARTKAILVVHIFGQSAEMKHIVSIARKYNLVVIEDACEAIGASYRGRKAGTFGQSAVFSFYPNKQITTGEGGMLVTNNRKVWEFCSSARNQGRTSDMRWLDHVRLGYNYRMDEMSSALGIAQITRLPQIIQEREKIAGWYEKYLRPYGGFIRVPQAAPHRTHSWFVYVIEIVKPGADRDRIIKFLQRLGVSAKAYLPSIHLLDFYHSGFHYRKGDFPVSERLSARTLALPFYNDLKEADVKEIGHRLLRVLRV